MSAVAAGPLLKGLLDAQRSDEEAVSYPALKEHAAELVTLCARLGEPVVWPVGESAQRLLGAAVLLSRGQLRPFTSGTDVRDKQVLLVTVAAVTPLALLQEAEYARRFGAEAVDACAVDMPSWPLEGGPINTYWPLILPAWFGHTPVAGFAETDDGCAVVSRPHDSRPILNVGFSTGE